eukprot:8312956-Pyramimonas_sp.AAC.1
MVPHGRASSWGRGRTSMMRLATRPLSAARAPDVQRALRHPGLRQVLRGKTSFLEIPAVTQRVQ